MPERIVMTESMDSIHQSLARMTALVSSSMEKMTIALANKDHVLANEVIALDEQIDAMELKIEKDCIVLIARHQPIASDLREVTSVLKVITDLERVGDLCEDICKYILLFENEEYFKPLVDLPNMAESCKNMINLSITSFITKDLELAREALNIHDKIREIYVAIKDELIGIMEQNGKLVRQGTYFILISKYLERISAHSENIAEWIIYNVTGSHL